MDKKKRLLLVALSPARERLVREEPTLVRDLLVERAKAPIPASLELDDQWVELQRALFDFLWLSGVDDARAEALTPRRGLSVYEDRSVDSSRIVPLEQCVATAEWVLALPPDCVERARRSRSPSPASRIFPESLGTSEADDHERVREGTTVFAKKNHYDDRTLTLTLERVRAFYADIQRTNRAVLAIRFRE